MKLMNLLLMILTSILLINCAQPNEPASINSGLQIFKQIETFGYAFDFDVSGELVFIAEDQRGFSIYNYLSATRYCQVDTLFDETPNPFENVRKIAGSVQDNFLLVYDRYSSPGSFNIYDISDYQNPNFLFVPTSNTANVQKVVIDINEENIREIFWTNNGTSATFNIATYDNFWQNTATIVFPNSISGFDYNDEMYVVAGEQYGIYFVDRATQEIIDFYNTPGEALDVKLVDNLAFVALWVKGFAILDISDPNSPTTILQHDVGDNIYTVDVKDDYLVLSSHSGGVFLYDISDLTAPRLLGNLRKSDISYTYKAAFHDDKIFASTRDGLVVLSY